jgi:curved DNA-binding protein CbpA
VQEKWARVSKARQILTNPKFRKIYDLGRAYFLSTSTSDGVARQVGEYILTDEQTEGLQRTIRRGVEMGERKNCRGENEEVWGREERLGGMESDADDGGSTEAVYGG